MVFFVPEKEQRGLNYIPCLHALSRADTSISATQIDGIESKVRRKYRLITVSLIIGEQLQFSQIWELFPYLESFRNKQLQLYQIWGKFPYLERAGFNINKIENLTKKNGWQSHCSGASVSASTKTLASVIMTPRLEYHL